MIIATTECDGSSWKVGKETSCRGKRHSWVEAAQNVIVATTECDG